MIRDPEGWRRWEEASLAAAPLNYEQRLRWYDAAIAHARTLGVWPPQDPMEGFEEKLEYIHRLHGAAGHAHDGNDATRPTRSRP